MGSLKQIRLTGFKSIKSVDLELGAMNILIGVNGAGKRNLVSFFKVLNEMMGERLQQYITTSGRAQSALHFGPKITPQMEAALQFEADNRTDTYQMSLFHAAGDTLVFAEEQLSFLQTSWTGPPKKLDLGSGHQETRVKSEADKNEPTAKVFRNLLNTCRVFHFHDTSPTTRARQYCDVGDNPWLMPDAGNVAAILYELKNKEKSAAYRRILTSPEMRESTTLPPIVTENRRFHANYFVSGSSESGLARHSPSSCEVRAHGASNRNLAKPGALRAYFLVLLTRDIPRRQCVRRPLVRK